MIKNFKPAQRHQQIVMQQLGEEVLIYDLICDKAYCLNEPAAMIYRLCDGRNSVSNIVEALSHTSKHAVPDEFVLLALDQFVKNDLLESPEKNLFPKGRTSRREAIRAIGSATMIALPVVSSLVAPVPASAQSLAAICFSQTCDCTDAFILAGAAPGTQCTGGNLATPCPTAGCRCFVRDPDPIGNDICAP